MLLIAIITLIVAQKTLENSDSQFRKNSQSSDSLFNIQLMYSKKLNDSLIYQIGLLQRITDKQLFLSSSHLKIGAEQLEIQKKEMGRRPKLSLHKGMYDDYDSTRFVLDGFLIQNHGNIEAQIETISLSIPTENLIHCEIENATLKHDIVKERIYFLFYSGNNTMNIIAQTGREIKANIIYSKKKNYVPKIDYSIQYSSKYDSGFKRGFISLTDIIDGF